MHPILHLLAPLLVLLPAPNAVQPAVPDEVEGDASIRLVLTSEAVSRPASPNVLMPQSHADAMVLDLPQQVSIEQRITLRVAPRQTPMVPMMFEASDHAGGVRYMERKFGKCLPVNGIASVQPVSGRKLLLIMRDNRLFSAELEKGCQAREFYSGFLVAKSADGMICKDRDKLRARSGTTCEVEGFRQIVELGV